MSNISFPSAQPSAAARPVAFGANSQQAPKAPLPTAAQDIVQFGGLFNKNISYNPRTKILTLKGEVNAEDLKINKNAKEVVVEPGAKVSGTLKTPEGVDITVERNAHVENVDAGRDAMIAGSAGHVQAGRHVKIFGSAGQVTLTGEQAKATIARYAKPEGLHYEKPGGKLIHDLPEGVPFNPPVITGEQPTVVNIRVVRKEYFKLLDSI